MRTLEGSDFTLTWNPDERLATIALRCTRGDGERARAIIEALQSLIGTTQSSERTRVLGFPSEGFDVDAEWRSRWSHFFREHARTLTMAVVGLDPLRRVMLRMYSIGTGMKTKAFDREDEARAWLLGGDS